MQTTLHRLYAPRWIEAARALWHHARRLGANLRRWQAQGATLRALGALDERMLRDLGIDRSDIRSIAAHPGDADRHLTWRSAW